MVEMIITNDIKSFLNEITGKDVHDRIAFNELAYGRRVADRIYAFCPFCGKIFELDASEIEEEHGNSIRLKKIVSCDCRKGLRYLRKGLFDGMSGKRSSSRKGQRQDDPLQKIHDIIQYRGDFYKEELEAEARRKESKGQAVKPLTRASGPAGDGSAGSGFAASAGAGSAAAAASSYIPDDFEPGMDPYDRQALYEEQLLDDWVIAGGGDPADFDSCVDAFSDPFGFHDDFGGGDGFFDGFGDGWGGGFGGGDD